jgi:hypothetical protein
LRGDNCFSEVASVIEGSTVSGSSNIGGAANTITLTFDTVTILPTGSVITLAGLTFIETADNTAITIAGTDAGSFTAGSTTSRAGWTKSTGTLVLTANANIAAGPRTVTVALTNKDTTVSQVSPTLQINVAGTSIDVSAHKLSNIQNMQSVAPMFTVKTVSATNELAGHANTITLTAKSNQALASGDTVTLVGLTFADDATNTALTITGNDAAKFTPAGGNPSTAGPAKGTGTLVLTLNTGINADTQFVVQCAFTNKATSTASVTPTLYSLLCW